eukprot:CFRG0515T1
MSAPSLNDAAPYFTLPTALYGHKEELEGLGARVVLLTFVVPSKMREWLPKIGVPADAFPILLDESKRIYQVYGMENSIIKTWSPGTILFYAKTYAKNIYNGVRPEKVEGREDLHQLGGDFIVDQSGRIRLCHRSSSPIDRVKPSDILDCLRKMHGNMKDQITHSVVHSSREDDVLHAGGKTGPDTDTFETECTA